MNQLRKHPALAALTAISVVSDPIGSMFAVFICGFFLLPFVLTYAFAAFLDPKTYSKNRPPD